MSKLKSILIAALLSSFMFEASAKTKLGLRFDDLSCYRSEIATFTSVFFKEKLNEKYRRLKVKSPVTRKVLQFHYMEATSPASETNWLFVFAGIGSSSNSIHSQKISYFLRQAGFTGNILHIPSVFKSDFVQSFGSRGIVGNIHLDVTDLNAAINIAISRLKKKTKVFTKIDYLGFSLGALSAAHLSKDLIESDAQYRPEKVFLMNSPVDLFKSLSRLDAMVEKKVSASQLARLAAFYVEGQVTRTLHENAEELFCQIDKVANKAALESFIASNLVSMAGNVFYHAQRRVSTGYFEQELGELSRFADREEKRRYWREARILASKMNFRRYVDFGILPSMRKSFGQDLLIDQINNEVSMRAVFSTISKFQKNFYLVHSTDDFLLSSPEEFEGYARYFLKENSFVVPRGGHLGLLHNRDALSFVVKHLK